MSGRVTITLGRSGQVVKRDAADSEQKLIDHSAPVGTKRSIRDRLGDGRIWSKRQRRDDTKWSMNGADMDNRRHKMPNRQIGQNDLRLKLMRKNLSRRIETHDKDQTGQRHHGRYLPANQDRLQYNSQEYISEPKSSTHTRRIPGPLRREEDYMQMDSLVKNYSWNSNGLRSLCLDDLRIVGTSRPISPTRRFSGVQSIRSTDPPLQAYSLRQAPFIETFAANVQAQKNIMIPPQPPSNSISPKSPFTFGHPLTVGNLLNALGLGKYAILFQAEEVDMAALKQMGDNDLKDLGIPMGPRKKILLATCPHPKRDHA